MNIERKHIDLLVSFGAGVGLGTLIAGALIKKKLLEDVEFQIETLENTYRAALALRDAEANIRADVVKAKEVIQEAQETVEKMAESVVDEAPRPNPYHETLEAMVADQIEPNIEGGLGDYSVSYIDEEEFEDGEGFKGRIEIIMSNGDPVFMMNDQPLDDWESLIGNSILIDMHRLCPPGAQAVLYVRNHQLDEDYEVIRVEP